MVNINDIYCFPVAHGAEGNQVGQAQFALALSGHLCAFHVLGNGFQEYLLHHLPRN